MATAERMSPELLFKAPVELSDTKASSLSKSENIQAVKHIAYTRGLSADIILMIIHEIESQKLSIPLKLELMSCLIPKHTVPEAAFIKMTCLLSDFKFNLDLKVEILKWMISVFGFLDSTVILKSLYEIFLNLIEDETLRPYICHLLHLITDKQHVTVTRANYILQLLEKLEPQGCLTAVLFLYTKQNPELLCVTLMEECKHNFESLGIYPELIQNVHQTALNILTHIFVGKEEDFVEEEKVSSPDISFHLVVTELDGADVVMEDLTISETATMDDETELLFFRSFEEMYKEVEILMKSNNVYQILKSKLSRLLLTSDNALSSQMSLFDFLLSSFALDFDPVCLSNILDVIYYMGESSTAISDFIRDFLSFWDGQTNFSTVLEIISYHEICCFGKIHHTLNYIKELLLRSPAKYKSYCLHYLSRLYQNWASSTNVNVRVLCEGDCSVFSDDSSPEEGQYHLYEDTVHSLGGYIDLICEILISENHVFQPCLLNQVLIHYQRVSTVHKFYGNLVIHLPTSPIYCSAIFSLNSCTLNCLSRLMLRYNSEVKYLLAVSHTEAYLASYFISCCFRDLCSILLNGKYSSEEKDTYLGKTPIFKRLKTLCPNSIRLFNFHMHPAVYMTTLSYIELIYAGHSLPALEDFRWDKDYLRYLEENGFYDLVQFIDFLAPQHTDE